MMTKFCQEKSTFRGTTACFWGSALISSLSGYCPVTSCCTPKDTFLIYLFICSYALINV